MTIRLSEVELVELLRREVKVRFNSSLVGLVFITCDDDDCESVIELLTKPDGVQYPLNPTVHAEAQ